MRASMAGQLAVYTYSLLARGVASVLAVGMPMRRRASLRL